MLLSFQVPGGEQSDYHKPYSKASPGYSLSRTGPSAILSFSGPRIPEVRPSQTSQLSVPAPELYTYNKLHKLYHLLAWWYIPSYFIKQQQIFNCTTIKITLQQREGEVLKDFLSSFLLLNILLKFHFIKDQERPSMSICTNKSIMKKSATSWVIVREHKWIPQRNNWKQSDSLSAQLREMQCSHLRKKDLKKQTYICFLQNHKSIWVKRAHLSTTNWQKWWITTASAVPFKAAIKSPLGFAGVELPSHTQRSTYTSSHCTRLPLFVWCGWTKVITKHIAN